MRLAPGLMLTCLLACACEAPEQPPAVFSGDTPLFVIAGQSNAEGNVRLSGLEAVRAALPDHDEPLTDDERVTARAGYREGIGDWCNPAEDYSDAAADGAIDALRAGGLNLSGVSADTTITGGMMAAYRYAFQEANTALGAPYESTESSPPAAHTTQIAPLGPGFGVWDNEETDVLFYGPELGFGLHVEQNAMLEAFDVVKVAMGGSSLYEHWAPSGPMRQKLYEQTDFFLAQRPDARPAALIWFQGFNDQFEDAAIADYAENLERLITDFRAAYGAVPVVIVEARRSGGLVEIAEAQQRVASTMDDVAIVSSDGMSECFHYDAASQLVIGQRIAQALADRL